MKLFAKPIRLLIIPLLFLIPSLVFAVINTTLTGWQVAAYSVTAQMTPTGYIASRVCNTSSKSYFIPTKTSAEFAAFSSHVPTGVSVLRCGDGVCRSCVYGSSETCSTCSLDCGSCAGFCGDDLCAELETCSNCPGDCGACTGCVGLSEIECVHNPSCLWNGSTCLDEFI